MDWTRCHRRPCRRRRRGGFGVGARPARGVGRGAACRCGRARHRGADPPGRESPQALGSHREAADGHVRPAARAGARDRRKPDQAEREGGRNDGRAAEAACRHRCGAEEHHRTLGPGCRASGHIVQQAGARRVRGGAAPRPGDRLPAALGLFVPGDAHEPAAGGLPAAAAQPAGADRHRLQVPAGKLPRAGQRGRRRGARDGAAHVLRRRAASTFPTLPSAISFPARRRSRR